MIELRFTALPTDTVRALQAGSPDSNDMLPERAVSDGSGNPCRHCLNWIAEGEDMLILGHRPFGEKQPYAETGPIFLCAGPCERWEGEGLPPIFRQGGEARLLKGYSPDDRIVYGLGEIVPPGGIVDRAGAVLADPRVAYVHVRSSTNNCYTCRVDRAPFQDS